MTSQSYTSKMNVNVNKSLNTTFVCNLNGTYRSVIEIVTSYSFLKRMMQFIAVKTKDVCLVHFRYGLLIFQTFWLTCELTLTQSFGLPIHDVHTYPKKHAFRRSQKIPTLCCCVGDRLHNICLGSTPVFVIKVIGFSCV